MNKVFVLVLADTETKEALGRVVNAMQTQARRFRGVPGDQLLSADRAWSTVHRVSKSRSKYNAKQAASMGQAAKNRRLLNGSRYCRYEDSVEIPCRSRTPPYEIRF